MMGDLISLSVALIALLGTVDCRRKIVLLERNFLNEQIRQEEKAAGVDRQQMDGAKEKAALMPNLPLH